jgi:hypothetical protein
MEVCVNEDRHIPRFVSIVAILLGTLDLVRGFMHTILLEYAALTIAGLDLSTPLAGDLLQLLGTFGISNYVTGVMLILLGWKARPLALTMLGVLPLAYGLGIVGIRLNAAGYPSSAAAWGGAPMMLGYLMVCGITFVVGTVVAQRSKQRA